MTKPVHSQASAGSAFHGPFCPEGRAALGLRSGDRLFEQNRPFLLVATIIASAMAPCRGGNAMVTTVASMNDGMSAFGTKRTFAPPAVVNVFWPCWHHYRFKKPAEKICRGKRSEQFRRDEAPPANEPGRVPKEGNGPLARKLRSECRHLKHK
jgi:hypothetical protein